MSAITTQPKFNDLKPEKAEVVFPFHGKDIRNKPDRALPLVLLSLVLPWLLLATSTPVAAAPIIPSIDSLVLQSALASYLHIFSILGITGCLVAERLLIEPDMSLDEEAKLLTIDKIYGTLAMLLIGSGFARAVWFGKGGDFYVHDAMFWIKMAVAGVWGGISLFPTVIFKERQKIRDQEDQQDPPVISQALTAQLYKAIDAEIILIFLIPFLASLMSRGVWLEPDLPWEIGAFGSVAATGGSFLWYAKKALNWSEEYLKDSQESLNLASESKQNWYN